MVSLPMSGPSFSDDGQEQKGTKVITLSGCEDKSLQIKFLCDPEWQLRSEDDVMLITIEDQPVVTMTLSRIDAPVNALEQMTKGIIQQIGQYRSGFRTEMGQVGGVDAVHVTGSPQNYPNIQLSDYYFFHDGKLYSLLFSVNSLEKFKDYAELFQRIKDSVEFIGS